MLESATVCAYDCAEHLDGARRRPLLAIVQMTEIAQLLVDQALNRECPVVRSRTQPNQRSRTLWEGACSRWRPDSRPGCWIRVRTYPLLR
ncbi:DUF6124 family protein [Pseudomonas sp. W4I3]|uniref:DUF6124 family protein n=1 Tax=Pseudomonas sp. W4I3 TaxID=3042294 RepID=UPI00358FE60E